MKGSGIGLENIRDQVKPFSLLKLLESSPEKSITEEHSVF